MAQAQEYGESLGDLELSGPGPFNPGDTVSFSGDGFLPESDTYVTLLTNADGSVADLGVFATDSEGSVAGSFAVPLDAADGAYTVSATGVTPDGATRILSGVIAVASTDEEPEVTTTTEAEPVDTTAATEAPATTTTSEADAAVPETLPFEEEDGGSSTGLIVTIGLLLLLAAGGFLLWRYRGSNP